MRQCNGARSHRRGQGTLLIDDKMDHGVPVVVVVVVGEVGALKRNKENLAGFKVKVKFKLKMRAVF